MIMIVNMIMSGSSIAFFKSSNWEIAELAVSPEFLESYNF